MLGGAFVLGTLVRALVRERDTNARLAVAEERARIARELHDVVAHSVGVMVVQAQAARSVLRADPDGADAALASVEAAGRDSLREMRRLLGVLRSDDRPAAPAELEPQPGLADLGTLIGMLQDAGVHVELRSSGEPARLSAGADLSAYRIVQESLTNVLKHADVDRASVDLDWEPGWLRIRVRDAGRAATVGGDATADGDGFTVTARIPVEGSS
jgi:signal transduction histidine kinase